MPGTAKASLLEKITAIARRAAEREGIEVWDVELAGAGRGRVLRIFIDKPSGVTHADCELISSQVGTVLDVEDVIPGASYHLEVSSPGIERRLHSAEHFARFSGRRARIELREPVDQRRRWEGLLRGVEGSEVLLETAPDQILHFRLDQIEKANLKHQW